MTAEILSFEPGRHAEIAPDTFASPKGFTLRGEVVQCKFPNMLALTWPTFGPDSVATFVLNPMQGQVSISLTHSGLPEEGVPSLDKISTGWPCRCHGCVSRLWFTTVNLTRSPSATS